MESVRPGDGGVKNVKQMQTQCQGQLTPSQVLGAQILFLTPIQLESRFRGGYQLFVVEPPASSFVRFNASRQSCLPSLSECSP